ncbi:putative 24-methylenesterol C-methyltransferase [Helianthus annuus]|uniref:24-methylenesterol C-methyltransferase n=1 Tax=Helianthus annuus TaxID=4232 RepID=A0A251VK43_HELAN|nr:putative 24-methylenesterol C-methyltransferase [Helianthus annuus]KAJ0616970.1 putative 24-methylenesterol C-methyltransferase [Helianthus annuus]KAJ0620043.1 putative 24-methylenesterol C-methyltransferase [Helianthus annuus]KAJ0778502.1 putative 24-methylenesterol C-methyltransferase [Helianthus annuus]KAJ0941454.1 putative 24-methylenesterol C-methyltransferase [Helianthus annuus]
MYIPSFFLSLQTTASPPPPHNHRHHHTTTVTTTATTTAVTRHSPTTTQPGKSNIESTKIHEQVAVDLINVKPGQKILDSGCGVEGPMRAIEATYVMMLVGIFLKCLSRINVLMGRTQSRPLVML